MRIALLSPIAWRTPPRHYGPWENIVSLLAEGLTEQGMDVTLFATGDSLSRCRLDYICPEPYEENKELDPKVWECLHIAHLFEQADKFDIIHNHFDFLPLTYSRLVQTPVVTTIHGFSSPKILPVYRMYNDHSYYVSISNSDRSPDLDYIATVYHGININSFTVKSVPGSYLVFLGRIHPEKGTHEAIKIALRSGMKLIIAGIIQDQSYFHTRIAPYIDNEKVLYVGSVGPEQRDSLLSGAYALLHPISFDEPFGLSVVESMACGTPVIAYKRGSMPEVVKNGETGYLVNNCEEAVNCLVRIADIDRIRCRQWAEERFSQKRMVQDYINVYNRILG
ncbi:MAG TPA: glycosyltransferase family 4 protein [Syntrophomonadaceae bacterium]|nr:glycosyltransferase family 4 protein [Syntrophomonadaceae bacterium]